MLASLLGSQAMVPLVEVDDAAVAIEVARALVNNGLPAFEVALRSPGAMGALARVRKELPEAVVGAGTVVSAHQLGEAVHAGAAFAVSPGSTPEMLEAATRCPVALIPGVATVTELMRVADAGFEEVKFFPASASGGASAVASLATVNPSVRFLPTGGIDADSAQSYLDLECVLAVGGSWVCPPALIRDRAWDEIGERARSASRLRRATVA